MGKFVKYLSLLICVLLCFGMTVPALAADIASAPVKGGDPLAGIDASNYNIWCYDSAESVSGVSAAINAYVTSDGVRTTEMTYTSDPNYGVKCAATVCEPVGGALGLGNHRITTCFVGANKLTVDLNYVAVTYLTVSDEKYGLVFRNTGGAGSVKLTEDTSASGGKWVTVYAPVTDSNKTNIVTRMNKSFGNMGLMWEGAKKADETLYVREIVFFKNEADVKAYAAAASVCYNGDASAAPAVESETPKTEKRLQKLKLMTGVIAAMRGANWAAKDENAEPQITVPTDPLEGLGGYDKWTYASAETLTADGAYLQNISADTVYAKDPNFAVRSLKLKYNSSVSLYRVNTAFNSGGKLGVDPNYIAVTYMTNDKTQATITFNTYTSGGSGTVASDTSLSNGKWRTDCLALTDAQSTAISSRMGGAYKNFAIDWTNTNQNSEIYIREVVFFENGADAAAYTEKAPAYYNYAEDFSWNVDPLEGLTDYDIWCYANQAALASNSASIKQGAIYTSDPICGVECVKVTDAAFQTQFTTADQFAIDEPKYIAVTYMTPDTTACTLSYTEYKVGGTISSDISSSNGKWTTAYTELNSNQTTKLVERLNAVGARHFALLPSTLGNLYIREIVFFENEADVKSYAEKVPVYYNYYSK